MGVLEFKTCCVSLKFVGVILGIWDQFLARNGLLHMYLKNAADWYSNLVDCLLEQVKHTETPILLALNGCAGQRLPHFNRDNGHV